MVAGADPGLDQQVGDQEQRQREQEHQRPCPTRSPTSSRRRCRSVAPAPSSSANAGNMSEVYRGADPEDEREQLRRHRVDAGRGRAEHDPDDDHVGREDDLLRDMDQEVRGAEADQLRAAAHAGDVRRERAAVRAARAAARASGSASRTSVVPSVSAPSRTSPPQRGKSDGDEHRVEHGRDEVAEVLHVPALLGDEQVVEESEREARREREDDEQRRDPRVPDEVVRGTDEPRARSTRAQAPTGSVSSADHGVDRQAGRGERVQVVVRRGARAPRRRSGRSTARRRSRGARDRS